MAEGRTVKQDGYRTRHGVLPSGASYSASREARGVRKTGPALKTSTAWKQDSNQPGKPAGKIRTVTQMNNFIPGQPSKKVRTNTVTRSTGTGSGIEVKGSYVGSTARARKGNNLRKTWR